MERKRLILPLHLATLSAFAFAQPLLDILERYPSFLISHDAGPADILLLLLILAVGIPAIFFLLGTGIALLPDRIARPLHRGFFGILLTVILLPPVHRGGMPPGLALTIALAVSALAVLVYSRVRQLRSYFTLLALALIVFPSIFLADSSNRRLLRRGDVILQDGGSIEADFPVVLVIFDALPIVSLMDGQERIDAVRYPQFARLAETSTWFRNTRTVASFTQHAVPAILTGRFPRKEKVAIYEDHPRNLFTLLAPQYSMHVRESFTQLLPPTLEKADVALDEQAPAQDEPSLAQLLADLQLIYLHVLLPEKLAASLPPVDGQWSDFGGRFAVEVSDERRQAVLDRFELGRSQAFDSRLNDALEFIGGISADTPKTLHFLHSLLPHPALMFTPHGLEYCGTNAPRPGLVDKAWTREERHVQLDYQRHLMQVGMVDRLLGMILDRLQQQKVFDEALVIVTADHGCSYWPESTARILKGARYPVDMLDVPLLVKLPGQQDAAIVDRHVQTTDILPTILEQLGMRMPDGLDGRSLFDDSEPLTGSSRAMDVGGTIYEYADLQGFRQESLQRKLSIFGSGEEGLLYSLGPFPELVGRRRGELSTRPADGWKIQLSPLDLHRARKGGGFVPVYLHGSIGDASAGDAPDAIVAVLNGVIQATGPVIFSEDGEPTFHFILPETAYRKGANTLELFLVDAGGEQPVLVDGSFRPFRFSMKIPPARYLQRRTRAYLVR